MGSTSSIMLFDILCTCRSSDLQVAICFWFACTLLKLKGAQSGMPGDSVLRCEPTGPLSISSVILLQPKQEMELLAMMSVV